MTFRNSALDEITSGNFKALKSDNDNIYAYTRYTKKKSVVVIINRNLANVENVKIKIPNIKKKSKLTYIKSPSANIPVKSVFSGVLKPAEIIVFTVE